MNINKIKCFLFFQTKSETFLSDFPDLSSIMDDDDEPVGHWSGEVNNFKYLGWVKLDKVRLS